VTRTTKKVVDTSAESNAFAETVKKQLPIILGRVTPAGVDFICPNCNFVTTFDPPENIHINGFFVTRCSCVHCHDKVRVQVHVKLDSDLPYPHQFTVPISAIIIPEELAKPMKISLKFILNQLHSKTCAPIIVTSALVLVAGIKELKVAKLFGWKKIPAIIQGSENILSTDEKPNPEVLS